MIIRFLLITSSLFIYSCKSQEITLDKRLENSFKEYILESRGKNSKSEAVRYLNNEGRFILLARNDFFSKIQLNNNSRGNLVEIFDTEIPSNLYMAVLKLESRIYLFKKSASAQIFFREIELKDLKNDYPVMSCVLLEMDKPNPNRLSSEIKKGSYHFTIYLTKLIENKILTYVPHDICID
ncbi:hypothetical protein [Flagellimonas pacifica]|uniref:Lipoprotein n=1 Tax=Flagellimonas pacifica TaxID=1247520 RepID=A0A285MXJ9_9FLAO|nr:hypothetical protein [Allomuricauda parva]SNZ01915.1 hypothetical protein SAMN06265377_3766 [Allomuricauda parva]